jgi:hypothetical protein
MARLLDVGYVYSGDAPQDGAGLPVVPGSLAALPRELREQLASALLTLEPGRIAAAISRVSNYDAALGRVLIRYADQFAYTRIFAALELDSGRAMQKGG